MKIMISLKCFSAAKKKKKEIYQETEMWDQNKKVIFSDKKKLYLEMLNLNLDFRKRTFLN